MDHRLQLITLRMGHHAAASGYHRLADALPGERITGHPPRTLAQRVVMKALAPVVRRSGSQWYNRASLHAELLAAGRCLTQRRTLFHFLYGENSYRYLGRLTERLRRGHRLIATYHTPVWRLQELVRDTDHIRRLDAAVVVSTSQLDWFAERLGSHRAFYVPHGIDTEFFVPPPGHRCARAEGEGFRFVCVGHHLRDYATLAAAAEILWQRDRQIEIVVVVNPSRFSPLARLPNVRNLSNVSDTALRSLYQTSDALLLPLQDATANNTLLEAMACGLPVISTDLQGVRDYVGASGAVLVGAGDAEALADAALQARNRELDLTAMAAGSRQAAERLSWPRVARVMQELYAHVLDGRPCGARTRHHRSGTVES